jgi:non-canonical poly(A) RNA polymerase PAPD5/7
MMLVAAVKRKSSSPPTTAAEQYVRFLDFYTDLDTKRYGVSVAPPKLFKKHDARELQIKDQIDAARRRGDLVRGAQWGIGQTRMYQPYLLCLQDPASPINDLGRKSNAIKHIQKTLKLMSNTLRRDMQQIFVANEAGRLWRVVSLLEPQVGRCHEVYLARRKKVEEFGLRILMRKKEEESSKQVEDGQSQSDSESAVHLMVDGEVKAERPATEDNTEMLPRAVNQFVGQG